LSDPVTQRSTLEKIEQLTLTPTSFTPLVMAALADDPEFQALNADEGSRRFLGLAYTQPASLLDYLPANTLIAIDEPEQCHAQSCPQRSLGGKCRGAMGIVREGTPDTPYLWGVFDGTGDLAKIISIGTSRGKQRHESSE